MSRHEEALEELRALRNELYQAASDQSYGFFHGGDPNNFSPDPECSTEEELARHKEACEAWPEVKCPTPHCTLFGLGTNTYHDETTQDWAERLDRCIARLERENG